MKLSAKTDYAARAVLTLARQGASRKAMKVEDLAAENNVPPNYLVQILIDLKAHGIVRSLRGKEGGYLLARPASDITLGEVLRAVQGPVFDTSALNEPACPAELRSAWDRLQEAIDDAADEITFQKLAEEGSGRQRMYYI